MKKVTDQEGLSIWSDDSQAGDWVWRYQEDADEWQFFTDDYEPATSIRVLRTRHHGTYPVVRRGTTMPKAVRGMIVWSGMGLFGKSDAGVTRVALDKAAVMKAADKLLATRGWMEK